MLYRHKLLGVSLAFLWACDGPTEPNEPPKVTILSPAAGSLHNEGANLRLEAVCSDRKSTKLPCQWWNGASQLPSGDLIEVGITGSGSLEFRVTAQSANGLSTEAKVSVSINGGPTVTKCATDYPRPDLTYSYGRPIFVCASASDPDGVTGPVSWEIKGQVLLAADTGSLIVPMNDFGLLACARDSKGAKACRTVPLKISGKQKFLSLAEGGPGWVFAQSDLEGLKPEMILDVTVSGDWPSYTADGNRILYAANPTASGANRHSLWFAAYDGRWQKEVPVTGCGFAGGVGSSDLSPDGNWIAFTGLVNDLGNELYLMRADGSSCRRLTTITCNSQGPPCRWDTNSPRFDRTGRYVFALRNRKDAENKSMVDLVKFDTQTNQEEVLAQTNVAGESRWPMSTNSTLVAFDQPGAPGGAKYGVVGVDGSNLRVLGSGAFPSFCSSTQMLVLKSALVSEVVNIADGTSIRQLNYGSSGYASVGLPRCQPQ